MALIEEEAFQNSIKHIFQTKLHNENYLLQSYDLSFTQRRISQTEHQKINCVV